MSELPSLTICGWFKRGWSTFIKKPKPIIGGSVIFSALYLAIMLISLATGGDWLFLIGQVSVVPVLTVGWYFLSLRIVRGDNAKSLDIFIGFSRFGTVWLTCSFLVVIVFGGFILLVLPGVIWGLKYKLSLFAVMDRKLSAGESIRFSGKITKGYKGKLFGTFIIASLLNLLTWPFFHGLRHLSDDFGPMFIVWIILFIVVIVVINPWIGTTFAAAYDSLVCQWSLKTSQKESKNFGV